MTTRHTGYLVVLDEDIREDDAQYVINALRMVKSVVSVTPVKATHDQVVARIRRDSQWTDALRKLILEGPPQEE